MESALHSLFSEPKPMAFDMSPDPTRSTTSVSRAPITITLINAYSPMKRLLLTSALAAILLAASTAPAFSQASVDRPEMVRDLKKARKTVAEANRTASQMAEEMTSLKKTLDRHLQKLNRVEEGTQVYRLTHERARAAHSELMATRKEMLDKKMAAYGSAIGSLNSALKTGKRGAGLAKRFEEKAEKTRDEIKETRQEGEKIEVIYDHGESDDQYREALDAQLRTLRHEVGLQKEYIKKLKANARKARKSSQDKLFDRLRAIKAALKRRKAEFGVEKKHLQDTARRLDQELRMRQKLSAFNQFYGEMQKLSEVTEGLTEEVKAIYEDLGETPSFGGSLPDPESLEDSGGSPVIEGGSSEPASSFKEGGSR